MKRIWVGRLVLIGLAAIASALAVNHSQQAPVRTATTQEYKVVIGYSDQSERTEKMLNAEAKQGWELVSVAVTGSPMGAPQVMHLYLRRSR